MDKEIFYLMRVFCCVVESGSFSMAATKLDVQPPAVSKAIAKLESILDKKLLNRTTRSVETSEVGGYFYKEAMSQLTQLNSSLEVVESWNNSVKGLLKITATPAVGEDLISPVMDTFCQKYPSVNLDLNFTNDIIKLPSQNIDIAIRSSNKLEDSSLRSKPLFNVNRVVVASPAYIEINGSPSCPDDIPRNKCLVFKHKKSLNTWSYISNQLENEITTNTTICCNNYASLKHMCINGMGIARLYGYQVKKQLIEGKLIELLPDIDWGTQIIHAVYHHKISDSLKLKAFLDHFVEQFQNVS